MAQLTIEGVFGADGVYEFDFNARPFTNGDLHLIKTVAGVRAGQLEEAMREGDNDMLVAMALIVLERNGKTVPAEALWSAEVGALRFEFPLTPDEQEDAEHPPKSEPGAGATGPGASAPSGTTSNGSGDARQAAGPPPIGRQP